MCNWWMYNFEIVQHILQMVQIDDDKSHATILDNVPITFQFKQSYLDLVI